MSYFFVPKEEDDNTLLKDTGTGSNYLFTGIYDITILAAIVNVNEHGARSLNLYVEYNKQPQMIYNAIRLEGNDGKPHFQRALLQKLVRILKIDSIADPVKVELPVGKNGAMEEVEALEDISNIDVAVRILVEHTKSKDGKIYTNKIIKNFFSISDNYATADELKNKPKEEWGMQYALELEKYCKSDSYVNCTEEEVKAAAEDRKKGENKPSSGFGKAPSIRKFGAR